MTQKTSNWLGAAAVAAMVCTSVGAAPIDDAERERIERELDETRLEIQRLSERLADLSMGLVDEEIAQVHVAEAMSVGDRAMLGVVLTDTDDDKFEGPILSAVTPDGPADKAGLRTGDRIVALDGARLGTRHGSLEVVEFMDRVKPGETVAVTVERDGREEQFDVVTAGDDFSFAFSFNDEDFVFNGESLGNTIEHAVEVAMDGLGGVLFGAVFPDVEVVELTPGLGDYFGVTSGLLVVRAPRDGSLDLRDGDVLLEIDGEALNEPTDLFKIFDRHDAGDTLAFKVVRQRQTLTIDAPMPEASDRHGMAPRVFIQRSGIEN